MTNPSVKAIEELEKPPTAKQLNSRWIPDDDPKPIVNTSYKKCHNSVLLKILILIILPCDDLYF